MTFAGGFYRYSLHWQNIFEHAHREVEGHHIGERPVSYSSLYGSNLSFIKTTAIWLKRQDEISMYYNGATTIQYHNAST
jgi:hypothetical protein